MRQKTISDAAHDAGQIAQRAIQLALRDIKENQGREGYRCEYDQALHIKVALKAAGLRLVRVPKTTKP